MKWFLRILRAVLIGGVLGYGLLCFQLYHSQEEILFPMPGIELQEVRELARRAGARELRLQTVDGVALYGLHLPAQGRRAVLYLGGNAEAASDSLDLQEMLVSWGWDALVPAYRGYPGSQGSPSEEGLLLDAQAAWQYLVRDLGIPPDRLVIHGFSLGGAVAVDLATRENPAGLVLQSTFLSMRELGERQYPWFPVRRLLKHPFLTVEKAPGVVCPTLVLHGAKDRMIPPEHGRQLADLIPDARFVEAQGIGHHGGYIFPGSDAADAYATFLGEVRDRTSP